MKTNQIPSTRIDFIVNYSWIKMNIQLFFFSNNVIVFENGGRTTLMSSLNSP